jgi:hypothetical protein
MRRVLVGAVLVGAMACAPTLVQMSLTQADIDAANAQLGPGKSTLKGSALIRQRGGGVVTCAGNEVYLIPSTESVTSEVQRVFHGDKGYVPNGADPIMGGGKIVVPPQPNRKAICNAQGFFTFAGIRAGRWYVMTNIEWTVGDERQGGTMLDVADVAEGQETEVVLSQ